MSNKYARYGNLTAENIEAFTERLREMLVGKSFTFVSVNEGQGWRPEVRVGQRLKPGHGDDGITLYPPKDEERPDWRHMTVHDTYGSWGFQTGGEDKPTYFFFDGPNRLLVEHYASAGWKMYWSITVEEP